ncbi:uncharacterized protein MYCFIDRAFT_170226 [Pseudocercospora fijiensis CIRAD86]|uniref:Uncharacterized protein n=1 Tax=Pseudocercospora fijiensis (strain CIRAD86) TaxID=383855 RepID=N1Q7I0_PSEFD|nr:uncharacterized protein MYCFIDRAFT_170226 [Pseudocercospora fijiensis CIRAD86]EME88629.1 hypothetical protein MYCFIDRAFT_170226 [Pseudocercospora fijiensis CIRAD86]
MRSGCLGFGLEFLDHRWHASYYMTQHTSRSTPKLLGHEEMQNNRSAQFILELCGPACSIRGLKRGLGGGGALNQDFTLLLDTTQNRFVYTHTHTDYSRDSHYNHKAIDRDHHSLKSSEATSYSESNASLQSDPPRRQLAGASAELALPTVYYTTLRRPEIGNVANQMKERCSLRRRQTNAKFANLSKDPKKASEPKPYIHSVLQAAFQRPSELFSNPSIFALWYRQRSLVMLFSHLGLGKGECNAMVFERTIIVSSMMQRENIKTSGCDRLLLPEIHYLNAVVHRFLWQKAPTTNTSFQNSRRYRNTLSSIPSTITTPVTMNALSDLLGSMGMSGQQSQSNSQQDGPQSQPSDGIMTYPRRLPHHELWFKCPDLDLLPNSDFFEDVWLPDPENIDHRPTPDLQDFQMYEFDTDCFHIMQPDLPNVDLSHCHHPEAIELFNHIDSLASNVGKTNISAIRHVLDLEFKYRIRLETHSDGETMTRQTDISLAAMKELLSINRPWVQLFGDSLYRKSAHSYLAGATNLLGGDIVLAGQDEEYCAERWATREPRTASKLVKRLLVASDSDIARLDNFANGNCQVKLPCDHVVDMTREEYLHTDENAWLNMACNSCGKRVLEADDIAEHAMIEKLAQYEDLIDGQADWEDLDYPVREAPPQRFYSEVISAGLFTAGRSFEAPEIVVPKLLQPVNFEETSTAISALQAWLSQQEKVIFTTPQELRQAMAVIVKGALRSTCVPPDVPFVPTPPGWSRFLDMWLDRTVNFLVDRRCTVGYEEHQGVHFHGQSICWGDPAAESIQRNKMIDDLANMTF